MPDFLTDPFVVLADDPGAGTQRGPRSARFGQGQWTAFIAPRGGPTERLANNRRTRNYLAQIPFSSLSCSRNRCATSTARLTLTPDTLGRRTPLGETLNTLAPWEQELHVWRERELFWSGPIRNLTFRDDEVTIDASDLSGWMERRTVGQLIAASDLDYSTFFRNLVLLGLGREPSPNIELAVAPSMRRGAREYDPTLRQRISDALSELSRDGVSWTVINRRWYVGPLPYPSLGLCPNEFFRNIEISLPGDMLATEVTVIGRDDGQGAPIATETLHARPIRVHNTVPLLEQVFQDDLVLDGGSAVSSARERLAFLSHNPVYPKMEFADAPLAMKDLIPGVLAGLRVSAGTRECFGTFRLDSLQCDVAVGEERITPSWIPADEPDAYIEPEEGS